MSDREAFRANRAVAKAKLHEKRLENATYTAAEVKVLTEAALRLGRKEALDEIAAKASEIADGCSEAAKIQRGISIEKGGSTNPKGASHMRTALAFQNQAAGAWAVLEIVEDLTSQPSSATSDATSGVPRHPEVSEAAHPGLHPLQSDCTEACWNKVDHP